MCYDSIQSDATGIYPLAVAVATYIKKYKAKNSQSLRIIDKLPQMWYILLFLYIFLCTCMCKFGVCTHVYSDTHNCACTEAR